MAIVTENVTVNSKQFKHIYSDAGYYIADSNSKNYVDVYDPEGSTKTYTETSVIIPQTVTQRYFEKRLLTKCDLDLSNSTRPHIIETYSNGTEWYRVFSDKYCEQGGRTAGLQQSGHINVTFLKPYKDTNYLVHIDIKCPKADYTGSVSVDALISDTDYTVNGFRMVGAGTSYFTVTNMLWSAKGYIN